MLNCTVVHTYITKCQTVQLPPGFADFLRGSLALHQLSKKYNYRLIIDFSNHPLGRALKNHSMVEIDGNVEEFFNNRRPLLVPFLERLHPGNNYCISHNFPDYSTLSKKTMNFVKKSIEPSDAVKILINDKIEEIGLDSDTITLHLRGGDHNYGKNMDIPNILLYFIETVIKSNHGNNVFVISDNKYLKDTLGVLYDFKVTEYTPVHLGSPSGDPNRFNTKGDEDYCQEAVNTYIEFMLMSKTKKIYQWSIYGGSGFSEMCSILFDIPFVKIE